MSKYESLFSLVLVLLLTPWLMAVDTDGDGLLDLIDVPGFDSSASGPARYNHRGIQDLDGANLLTNGNDRIELIGNEITGIEAGDFQHLNNLNTLHLSDNQITSIESGAFEGLEMLRTLGLWGNPITKVESGTFDGLTNLRMLYLSVARVEKGTFEGLTNLKELYLQGDQITSIEKGAFSAILNLQNLSLEGHSLVHLDLTRANLGGPSRCHGFGHPCRSVFGFEHEGSATITTLTLDDVFLHQLFGNPDPKGGPGYVPHSFLAHASIAEQLDFITNVSIVGLFSDAERLDLEPLLGKSSLRVLTVDQGLFETYTDELNAFATKEANTLTVIAYGDINRDMKVDFMDFVTLSSNYGEPGRWAQGDFNRDEMVDFADFLMLSNSFGTGAEAATVPEPAAGYMMLGICCCLIGKWRKRRGVR